jgi:hypothetical protein
MKALKNFTLIILIFFLAAGCSEEVIPSLEGDMIGYVFTFDEFGNLLDNHDGVTVTAYGPGTTYKGITAGNGYFVLRNVPTGTYEIHFEKEGSGTLKQFGVQHAGGQPTILGLNDEQVFFMYEMPTTQITNVVLNKDTAYAEFSFHKGPEPEFINVRLWFSDSPDFSSNSNRYSTDFRFGVNGPNRHYWIPENLPFAAGSRVWYKAAMSTCVQYIYPADYNLTANLFAGLYRITGISRYLDLNTKKNISPNLGNETEVYSFILPN